MLLWIENTGPKTDDDSLVIREYFFKLNLYNCNLFCKKHAILIYVYKLNYE